MNTMTTPNGISFFNGTPCPIVSENYRPFEKIAMDIFKACLLHYSIEELKKINYEKMVYMESLLTKICDKRYKGLTTDKNIKKWLKTMNCSEWQAECKWYTTVYTLLKLNVIENDMYNGMLFYTKN